MELFKDLCYLFAGLGVFLLGMYLMGEGLQKSAGKSVKVLFNKLNDKSLVSFGIGLSVTAVVQASSVTSVVAIGFVNAGLMSLPTALATCLGAKVGTTVTGLLASLSSLPISSVFCLLALVGTCFVIFSKKDKVIQIGYIIGGLGTLFSGMYLMKSAIQNNADIMGGIQFLFQSINIPVLLVFVGIAATILVQSSSTISVILIALSGVNAITFETGMFILIGASVGTTVTPLIASVGANKDGKRLALLNMLSSAVAACVLGIIIDILEKTVIIDGNGLLTAAFEFIPDPSWKLAVFGFLYNLVAAVLLLPFVKPFTALGEKLVKDRSDRSSEYRTYYIDDRLFQTPQLAIMQVKKEISHLGSLAVENLERGLDYLIDGKKEDIEVLEKTEELIDHITKRTSKYLVDLAGLKISKNDETFVGSMHHVIDDIERIGDYAYDFSSMAGKMDEEDFKFSGEAVAELSEIRKQIREMAEKTFIVFDAKEEQGLPEISNYVKSVRELKRIDADNHISRLNKGGCDMETGAFFYSALTALERVAEHLVNVAFSIKSITGSQAEAYASMKGKEKDE